MLGLNCWQSVYAFPPLLYDTDTNSGYRMDQSSSSENEQSADSSLESPQTDSGYTQSSNDPEITTESTPADRSTEPAGDPGPKPLSGPRELLRRLLGRFNIYLLIFILILIVVGVIGSIFYLHDNQQKQDGQSLATQSLSTDDLNELANTGVNVGDPKQVLTIQSNTVLSGKVLARSDLEVAGKLTIGGSLSLAGINVSGTSTLDTVQVAKNLSVGGDTAVQGKLTARSIATSGGASFGGDVSAGQLTANSLRLTGDLTITHHIVIGGSTPSRSSGGALGSGGTAGVSGSDTAGTITINTGSSPSAGCFITVHFARKYNQTPRVLVTPVGSAAGAVGYYTSRNTTGFSVCGSKAAAASRSFGFDYFVVE